MGSRAKAVGFAACKTFTACVYRRGDAGSYSIIKLDIFWKVIIADLRVYFILFILTQPEPCFVKIIPLPAVGAVAVLPVALGIAGAALGVHQLLQAVVAVFKTQHIIGGSGAGAFDGYFF